MADVTPVGPIAVAVDALRTLIANVSLFQTWTDSDNASEALVRVFAHEIGIPVFSLAIASDVLTVVTSEPHAFTVGETIELDGASIGRQALRLNGEYTVVGVPNSLTFTVAVVAADLAAVNPDGVMALPTSRPLVCVCEDEDALNSESVGTGGACIFNGALQILVEADVSSDNVNNAKNAQNEARNAFGQLMQGIMQVSGTGNFMLVNHIETLNAPKFIERTRQADNTVRFERWQGVMRATWGLQ